MNIQEKWDVVHAYRRDAIKGVVPMIRCPDDGDELVPAAGIDDGPIFKCFNCKSTYHIGLDIWDQMKSNLKEAAHEY